MYEAPKQIPKPDKKHRLCKLCNDGKGHIVEVYAKNGKIYCALRNHLISEA